VKSLSLALSAISIVGIVAFAGNAIAQSTTIGLEMSPEFGANPASASYGDLDDIYVKGTISHTVAPGWSIGGSGQVTDKFGTWQAYLEVNAAYKASLNDDLSVTLTGALGYTFGNTGYLGGLPVSAGTDPFAYWFLQQQ
jgi:hypothetical protein